MTEWPFSNYAYVLHALKKKIREKTNKEYKFTAIVHMFQKRESYIILYNKNALQNDLEEVLYSDGEGVPDPYPNNTWDSEEEIGGDDYSLTSGWI